MRSPTFQPSHSLRERWLRLRNFQSKDFWAMVFARPLTILFLLPVADRPWVTPDGITGASVFLKLAGLAVLWWVPSYAGGILGVVLVNLGLVFDNMDGTLARYRNSSSFLGYYLDKAVDIICLAGLFAVVALRAGRETGDWVDLFLPMLGFAGASVAAYCKWVAYRVETDLDLRKHWKQGSVQEFVERRLQQNPPQPPPVRTFADWTRWFGQALLSILLFNEVDIFFFLLVAVLWGDITLFTRILAPLYALGMVIGPAHFFWKLRGRIRSEG